MCPRTVAQTVVTDLLLQVLLLLLVLPDYFLVFFFFDVKFQLRFFLKEKSLLLELHEMPGSFFGELSFNLENSILKHTKPLYLEVSTFNTFSDCNF